MNLFKAILARYKNMGLDITPVQSRIVMFLYEANGYQYQKDIEQYISCNKSTISNILNTMEKNGLIKRVENPKDSRMKIIELTDKSKYIAELLRNDRQKIKNILGTDITLEEVLSLQNVLVKIKKNIERI